MVCDLRPSPWPVTGDGQARGRQHVPFPYPQCGDVGAPGGQGGDAGDKLRAALAHSASVTRVVAALGASGHCPGAGVQGPPNSEPQASLAPWRVRAGAAGGAWAQAISGNSRRGSDVFFSVEQTAICMSCRAECAPDEWPGERLRGPRTCLGAGGWGRGLQGSRPRPRPGLVAQRPRHGSPQPAIISASSALSPQGSPQQPPGAGPLEENVSLGGLLSRPCPWSARTQHPGALGSGRAHRVWAPTPPLVLEAAARPSSWWPQSITGLEGGCL